jgi:hypothetical protein
VTVPAPAAPVPLEDTHEAPYEAGEPSVLDAPLPSCGPFYGGLCVPVLDRHRTDLRF